MALFCSSSCAAIILLFLCLLVLALQDMSSAFQTADVNVPVMYITPTLRQDVEYVSPLDSQYGNRCSRLTEFCTENHHCCEPSKNKCSKKNQCCKRIKAKCFHNYECCTSACYKEECCKPTGAHCRFNDQCCSQNCEQSIGADYDGLCGQSELPHPTCAGVGELCSMYTPCCDTGSHCNNISSRCCKMSGAFCDISGQCCGNNVCHLRKCCKTQNMKCSRNEQCCSGYYCSNNGFGEFGFCIVYPIYYDLPLYGNQFRQLQHLTDKEIVAAADEDVEDINEETSSSA